MKINIYFLFVALAFGLSAYLLLLDNADSYVAKSNILIYPKNVKTAVYLNRIKENIIVLVGKNNLLKKEVVLKTDPKTDLIEIQAEGENKIGASILVEESVREIINLASKHYDVKNDLALEIVFRETQLKTFNKGFILLGSIVIGLVLAFFIQILLNLIEGVSLFFAGKRVRNKKEKIQTENYLGDLFRVNREKIEKLSSAFPLESRGSRMREENKILKDDLKNKYDIKSNDEYQPNFKKAAFPANLPVAQDDLKKIIQNRDEISNEKEVLGELGIFPESEMRKEILSSQGIIEESNLGQDDIYASADNLKEALSEPTEEDFKKRLNQLLGNK